jgi:hypothetical protein
MNSKRYSDEEAREILKRAVDFQQQDEFEYTRDQLLDLGREMGLSQDAIVKAEQEYRSKSRWRKKKLPSAAIAGWNSAST